MYCIISAIAYCRHWVKHSRTDKFAPVRCRFCPFAQRTWITLEAKGVPYVRSLNMTLLCAGPLT
jgi:Glutathione S-transferase, N-terminal domain